MTLSGPKVVRVHIFVCFRAFAFKVLHIRGHTRVFPPHNDIVVCCALDELLNSEPTATMTSSVMQGVC